MGEGAIEPRSYHLQNKTNKDEKRGINGLGRKL